MIENVNICRIFIRTFLKRRSSYNYNFSSQGLTISVNSWVQFLKAKGLEVVDDLGEPFACDHCIDHAELVQAMEIEKFGSKLRGCETRRHFKAQFMGPTRELSKFIPENVDGWERAIGKFYRNVQEKGIGAESPKLGNLEETAANENNARKGV